MSDKETINFTLRMPVAQRFALDRIAFEDKRTTTNLINMILQKHIEAWQAQKNKDMD